MSDDKVEDKLTIDVAIADAAPAELGEKQGTKCCGFCCDYRRAVIIIAIIGMIWNGICIILAATGTAVSGVAIGDAAEKNEDLTESITKTAEFGALTIGYAIGICFNIFQASAAVKYNTCMLGTCIVFQVLGFIYVIYANMYTAYMEGSDQTSYTSLTITIICSGILYGLFIYPIAGLISEIKSGVMSKETYPREAYSCCCQPTGKA